MGRGEGRERVSHMLRAQATTAAAWVVTTLGLLSVDKLYTPGWSSPWIRWIPSPPDSSTRPSAIASENHLMTRKVGSTAVSVPASTTFLSVMLSYFSHRSV